MAEERPSQPPKRAPRPADAPAPAPPPSAASPKPAPKPAAAPESVPAPTPPATAKAEAPRPSAATPTRAPNTPPNSAALAKDNVATIEQVDEPTGVSRFFVFAAMPSWLVSLVLHVILVLILALLTLPAINNFKTDLTVGTPDVVDQELTNFEESNATVDMSVDVPSDVSVDDAPVIETDDPALVDDAFEDEAAAMAVELSDVGFEASESTDLLAEIGSFSGSGLSGRSAAERTRLVREAGGTEGSEQAVKRALQWFKRHQNPDGSWSFYHLGGRCPCKNHGELAQARIGATAMALLPFLGSGNTHQSGNYQDVVGKGLYFLKASQKANGSLHEPGGNMYSHGLAAITLCEAYAMTGDKALFQPAQGSLNFIAYAQDPITRGWRYKVRDLSGGDTSVVGWQLMALKSGHMSGLKVNGSTVQGTSKFLDFVQADGGAGYGYQAPGTKNSTTAIGLLCRMYLGWQHDHPPLVKGVKRLSKSGPSKVDLYYNYYATQVMRHYGNEEWEKWNPKMRDFLVETQSKKGHSEGSWHLGKGHGTKKGGRLYCTSMATMILEVYYRHLPIYGKKASEEEFEL